MNTAPMVIRYGIGGTHATGKSSMADNLVKHLNLNVLPDEVTAIRANFADPLRRLLASAWPFDLGNEKRHPLEREALQATGEVWRTHDRMNWVHASLHNTEERIDLLAEEHDPVGNPWESNSTLEGVIVVYSDVYHVNEAIVLDRLLLVQNRDVDIAPVDPDEYQPHSIAQTNWMLRNADLMSDVMNASGAQFRRTTVNGPEDLNNELVVQAETLYLLDLLNQRRDTLGLPPVDISQKNPTSLFAEAVERRAGYAS